MPRPVSAATSQSSPAGVSVAPRETLTKPLPELGTASRLDSLDAYRGMVMLAMCSGAFALAEIDRNAQATQQIAAAGYQRLWDALVYQFSHVAWTGCAFWDLIQPSFMFIVGVALPFSMLRRQTLGQGVLRRALHVLYRAAILVVLGVMISSNYSQQTHFTFVNVLSQIGLALPLLYLLAGRTMLWQLAAVVVLCVGCWLAFFLYEMPADERYDLDLYLRQARHAAAPHQRELYETDQFSPASASPPPTTAPGAANAAGGPIAAPHRPPLAAHWNKHTNFAAALDRWLLNLFPRQREAWEQQARLVHQAQAAAAPHGPWPAAPLLAAVSREAQRPFERRVFWVNPGGYQTFNFVPSLITMILGAMAGRVLLSARSPGRKVLWLFGAGGVCFLLSMAVDTTIWPARPAGWDWTLCPAVKRIWTPTFAVFSAGWAFLLLALFYLVIDVWHVGFWAWKLRVVGLNSIAAYCIYQFMRPWIVRTVTLHARGLDAWLTGGNTSGSLFTWLTDADPFAPLWRSVVALLVIWLMCWYLYRHKLFFKI
jgi:heparan-alpha-glucosaminide N-acetyltransferase